MATGATNSTVELIEQPTVARYTTRNAVLSLSNRGSNGTVKRKPDTGLRYPQFLQQAGPIAVQSLRFGLRPRGLIPNLVAFGMVDVHMCDVRFR